MATAPEPARLQERDFVPWFMVLAAIALVVIFEQTQVRGNFLVVGDPHMEGTPLAISWESGNFRSYNSATPQQINSLEFLAKNIGADEIDLKDAYILSAVDSTKIPMTVSTPPGPNYRVEDILPIPPDAWIHFGASFGDGGLAEAEILNKWARFRAVIVYDDKNVRHDFNTSWVMQRITGLHPEAAPHISKRQ
jgi:hypothetical protein